MNEVVNERITKRIRYRPNIFGKLILQVEVEVRCFGQVEKERLWRDAYTEDLTSLYGDIKLITPVL